MFTLSHVISTIVAAIVFVVIVEMLRRGKLRERHALWWLCASVFGLIVTLFPGMLDWLAKLLGVADPLNLAFFGGIIVLFLVSTQQATELTRAEERTRTLAEKVALLEDRMRQIENGGSAQDPQKEKP